MNCQEVLQKLKSFGSPQFCKTFARHGVREPMFGVSYKHLGTLTRQLKPNHALALDLWASGIHDARVLATMIAEPAKLTSSVIDRWLNELPDFVTSDAFAGLVAQSPLARKKAAKWRQAKSEMISNTGWGVTLRSIQRDPDWDDRELAELLCEIETRIHSAPNRTRYAMNLTVICIGIRNAALRKLALASAKRIGKVEVDHGDTSCRTPDAAAYIKKTVAHQREMAKRRAHR
jgi:3-methyladenine DNA glycosylase AlkD